MQISIGWPMKGITRRFERDSRPGERERERMKVEMRFKGRERISFLERLMKGD